MANFTEEQKAELIRMFLEQADGTTPPSKNGPGVPAVDKFAHIPEHARSWLAGKGINELATLDKVVSKFSPDDIDKLATALTVFKAFLTVGVTLKWLVISFVAFFLGSVALGEGIGKFLAWFKIGAK